MRKACLSLFLLPVVMFMFLAAPVCADEPENGLMAWWRAEGNTIDSAGANNGTAINGVTYAAGKIGRAFSLNGTNQAVAVPDGIIPNTARNFTVSAWVYPNDVSDGLIYYGGANAGEYILAVDSGNFNFCVNLVGSGFQCAVSPETSETGAWYSVVGIRRGTALEIWVNGVMKNSIAIPDADLVIATWDPTGFPSRIGAYHHAVNGDYHFWSGRIDEVKLYTRSLTANEVANLAGFNFISQTGMPLSTTIVSNPVTTSFISSNSAISITGGSYEINSSGTWTTDPGTINPNDTVKVRLTSASSNSTPTTATLTIGTVSSDFTVTTAASGDPNASGLISWWKAENNAYDSVGGNHGTANGGTTYNSGRVGQAFNLSGAGQYLQKIAPVAIPVGASPRTVSAWIRSDGPTDGTKYQTVVGYGTPWAGSQTFLLEWGGAGNDRHLYLTGWSNDLAGTTTLEYSRWYHVAATYDGTTVRLYVNGSLDASADRTLNTTLNSDGLLIGTSPSNDGWHGNFKGMIDEVKIFSRVLAATELSKLAGTYPDAFSFTAQTGMPLSTTIVSNPITVTGITSAAAISISGNSGEYSISTDSGSTWGSWTSTAVTVSLNNQVKVRQPSSASNSTLTTTTLTIGGVSGAFDVTTAASGDPNASGLVSWWKAENNAYDSVGGNNGILQGGTTYATGKVDRAFSFNGGSDSVNVPAFNMGTDWTVAGWLYPTGASDGMHHTFFSRSNGNLEGMAINYVGPTHPSANQIIVVIGNGGSSWQLISLSGTQYPLNSWHHVAFSKSGDTYTLYVNGQVKNQQTVAGVSTDYQARAINLGHWNYGVSLIGLIDETKIFNRALSALEISILAGTKPDAFSFTAQTGVALSTLVESNAIAVAGITNPAAISITGGEYSINGSSSWTSSSGTVSSGDQVKVRLTSSGSYSTMLTATLTIGGVSGTFNVTTMPQPYLLTVTKDGTGSGTVIVDSGSLSWIGKIGTASYAPGTEVKLTGSADPGSSLIGFKVDCISNTGQCTVTMDSPKSVTATFDSNADFTGNPQSGSVPHNVVFTDTSTHSPISWSWTFGDGGTSTQKNPVHTYRADGLYTVALTATGIGGASTMTKPGYVTVSGTCSNYPYKIGGSTYNYDTIQHAYDSPGTAGLVQIQALVFTGGLMLNQSKDITLQGGYGCDFTSNPGDTIVSDKLTIKDGKVTIEKLTIK